MTDWRKEHGAVIHNFLKYLNEKSDNFILKGGTALLMCYKLDRFSEDIDLDGKTKNIQGIMDGFCQEYAFSYRTAKDTDTVKRYMINYGNNGKPLKVEISFRRKHIDDSEITNVNGIKVYNINTLCAMKTNAYSSRDKIRDLYDLTFICNNYYEQLLPQTLTLLRSALEYKGVEQFDYIMKEQHDELIDENKLAESFLLMFDKLGLLFEEKEKQMLLSHETAIIPEKKTLSEVKKTAKEKAVAYNESISSFPKKTKETDIEL